MRGGVGSEPERFLLLSLKVVIASALAGTVACGWGAAAAQVVAEMPVKTQNSVAPPQERPESQLGPPALTIPRLQRAPALEDFLSMKPQGEIALQMAKVTGFTQRNPHDGESVTEPTEAYLGYNQKNLYVVFVCFDDPREVRARMSPREDVYDDDEVEVMLDTFHDRAPRLRFSNHATGGAVGRYLDGGFAGRGDQRAFRYFV